MSVSRNDKYESRVYLIMRLVGVLKVMVLGSHSPFNRRRHMHLEHSKC